MTRNERRNKIGLLLGSMPIRHNFIDFPTFYVWQGEVSALLAYKPEFQSEFREIIKHISDTRVITKIGELSKAQRRILAIMAEAISELAMPGEEPIPERATATTIDCLTDEHNFWWWLNHCKWAHWWHLLYLLVPLLVAAFVLGFSLGMMDEVRNLYVSFMNPQKTHDENAVTDSHPNKYPRIINATESPAKNFDQPATTSATTSPSPTNPNPK